MIVHGRINMKMNKYAWFSIILTTVLLGLLGVLLLNGTLHKETATTPAEPYETVLFWIFLVVLAVWCLSAALGWIMLSRRGFFSAQMERLAGHEWTCCIGGIFLLAGLWMVAVIPGPYLMWFASTRQPLPRCPKCKNWMPQGATHCVHCDTPLQTEPVDTLTPPRLAESAHESILGQKCEKCQETNRSGAVYSFAYGTLAGSDYLGNQTTRYSFKIAGSQDVFLCDQCVTEFGKKRTQKLSLGISLGVLAIVVGLSVISLLINAANPGGAPQIGSLLLGVVVTLLLVPVIYFGRSFRVRKQPLAEGDRLAIELRKPALTSQGYTRFFTRQQMRDNQVL
jgi:hypothetical protein